IVGGARERQCMRRRRAAVVRELWIEPGVGADDVAGPRERTLSRILYVIVVRLDSGAEGVARAVAGDVARDDVVVQLERAAGTVEKDTSPVGDGWDAGLVERH